jgi:hypothetical protein
MQACGSFATMVDLLSIITFTNPVANVLISKTEEPSPPRMSIFSHTRPIERLKNYAELVEHNAYKRRNRCQGSKLTYPGSLSILLKVRLSPKPISICYDDRWNFRLGLEIISTLELTNNSLASSSSAAPRSPNDKCKCNC